MGPHTQIEGIVGEEERKFSIAASIEEVVPARNAGAEFATTLSWLPERKSAEAFHARGEKLLSRLKKLVGGIDAAFAESPDSEDLLWLRTNAQQLASAARALVGEFGTLTLPVVSYKSEILPRVLAIADGFLEQVDTTFSKSQFTAFCMAFQETTPLEFHEIGSLVPALKLVLIEGIAELGVAHLKNVGHRPTASVVPLIRNYQHVAQASWKEDLESLIPFDDILLQDPTGAYGSMDFDSRNSYRERVSQIARRSDLTEMEVAKEALALARKAQKRGSKRSPHGGTRISYWLLSRRVKEARCSARGWDTTPISKSGFEAICAFIPMNTCWSASHCSRL